MHIYFHLLPAFCFKRAFRNLGRKIENGARTIIGKDHKFNPYKRGFTNSKEVGAKFLEEVYDYNKTKKKTDRMNHELQKLASKSGLDIEDVEVNKNLFKKIGDLDDDSNNGPFSNINMSLPSNNVSELFETNNFGEDSCAENLLKIKQLLESKQEEDNDDGSLGIDSLQSLVSRRGSVDSIEIFPGDIVNRKEVITISRNA